MLTMIEKVTPGDAQQGEGIFYAWEIPGLATSTDGPDEPPWGLWPSVTEAFSDLQAYLHEGKMPALPSTAQIVLWSGIDPPQVSHVVRIG